MTTELLRDAYARLTPDAADILRAWSLRGRRTRHGLSTFDVWLDARLAVQPHEGFPYGALPANATPRERWDAIHAQVRPRVLAALAVLQTLDLVVPCHPGSWTDHYELTDLGHTVASMT